MKVMIDSQDILNLKLFDFRWPQHLRKLTCCLPWSTKRAKAYQDFLSTSERKVLMTCPEGECLEHWRHMHDYPESEFDSANADHKHKVTMVNDRVDRREVLLSRYAIRMFRMEVEGYQMLQSLQGIAIPALCGIVETLPPLCDPDNVEQHQSYPGILTEFIDGVSLLEASKKFSLDEIELALHSAIKTVHLLPQFGVFNDDIQARNFIVHTSKAMPTRYLHAVMIDLANCKLINKSKTLNFEVHKIYCQKFAETFLYWDLEEVVKERLSDMRCRYRLGRFASFGEDDGEDNHSWYNVMSCIWSPRLSPDMVSDLEIKSLLTRHAVAVTGDIFAQSPGKRPEWESPATEAIESLLERLMESPEDISRIVRAESLDERMDLLKSFAMPPQAQNEEPT